MLLLLPFHLINHHYRELFASIQVKLVLLQSLSTKKKRYKVAIISSWSNLINKLPSKIAACPIFGPETKPLFRIAKFVTHLKEQFYNIFRYFFTLFMYDFL